MSQDLYESLGIIPDATDDEIKQAYRKNAMKKHPDRGGSKEEFHALQVAYDVLTDPEKRQRYDETGKAGPDTEEDVMMNQLGALLLQLVDTMDVELQDIAGAMTRIIAEKIVAQDKAVAGMRHKILLREKAIQRLSRKSGGENAFASILEDDVANLEQQIRDMELVQVVGRKMLALVDGYVYKVDEAEAYVTINGMRVGKIVGGIGFTSSSHP
jgi:curved DNA-binding protein CbpA